MTLGLIPWLGPGRAADDEYQHRIVVLRDNTNAASATADHRRLFGDRLGQTFDVAFNGYAAPLTSAEARRLRADPRVADVVPDKPIATLEVTTTGAARIGAPVAPGRRFEGKEVDVGVAIVDSGVDPDHPDLNVAGGVNCSGDLVRSGFRDVQGHGTHVAGIVAARRNSVGITGVAPGAPIWSVRVFDSLGLARTSNVLCALEWLIEHGPAKGIRVANLSIGADGLDRNDCGAGGDVLHRSICAVVGSGVTLVAAAGNDGTGFTGTTPAAYDEVLTVTAMVDYDGEPGGRSAAQCDGDDDPGESDDASANFSNFAYAQTADVGHTIAAPGACITSTWPGSRYAVMSGTSMAAPHVTGAVARCIQDDRCSGLGPQEIVQRMLAAAREAPEARGFAGDPRSPKANRYYGDLVSVASANG